MLKAVKTTKLSIGEAYLNHDGAIIVTQGNVIKVEGEAHLQKDDVTKILSLMAYGNSLGLYDEGRSRITPQ